MDSSRTSGYLFGLVAYLWWGLVPLYFREIKEVPALQILAHRIVWSVVLMLALTALLRAWKPLLAALRSRTLVLTMLLSGSLLAVNWYLYVYATVTNRVAEAGLGYYMMPLVNAFLATVFLGEKLRPAHWPGLALLVIGVSIPMAVNDFPWLAVVLPFTFGFYGLVRKVARVDSFTGLSLETLLLGIPSLIYLIIIENRNEGFFGINTRLDLLLMAGGIITVVPLYTYILSLRRLPLLAVNLLQFVSPTMQLIIGYYVLNESLTWDRWAATVCVWIAVAIFIMDAIIVSRKEKITIHDPGMDETMERVRSARSDSGPV